MYWQCCRTNFKLSRTLQDGQANLLVHLGLALPQKDETILYITILVSGQDFVIFTHLPLVSISSRDPNVVLWIVNCLCLPCWKLCACVYFTFETWLPATVFSSLLLAACNFSIYTAEQQFPHWVKRKSDVFTVILCKDYNEILFGSALQINIHLYGGRQGLSVADQNVNTRREWEAVIPRTPRGAVKTKAAPCRAARPIESRYISRRARTTGGSPRISGSHIWIISPSAFQVWFGAWLRVKVLHVLFSSHHNIFWRGAKELIYDSVV